MSKKIILVVAIVTMVMVIALLGGCTIKDNYPDEFFDEMRLEDSARLDNTDARIMSANVLVHIKSWGGTPVSPRAEIFAEALECYKPDVVGVQEFCGCFYNEMPKRSPDYLMLDTKKSDYTSIMYNSKTVKLVEQGILRYSKESNKNCRFVVWGVFEKLDSGKRFAVTSTHWDFGMEPNKVEMRTAQLNELSQLIDKIAAKYDVPVFASGDYNAFEKDIKNAAQSYKDFVEVSKAVDVKFLDNIEIQLEKTAVFEEESWDHIFLKGEATPLKFGILYNEKYYEALSDHPLIYVDSTL